MHKGEKAVSLSDYSHLLACHPMASEINMRRLRMMAVTSSQIGFGDESEESVAHIG